MTKTLLTAMLATTIYFLPQTQHLCTGIVPENDMYIPVESVMSAEDGGVSEAEFNEVIDKVEAHYSSIIKKMGGTLDVKRRWSDGTVNASAQRQGSTYVVNMYGGLARHTRTTPESFMLVVCHELGHHIGGSPKISGWFNSWASNEGQSDYFGSLKCMRRVLENENNVDIVENMEIDAPAEAACIERFENKNDAAICMRTAMAGKQLALLFKDLRKDATDPHFDTPDRNEVPRTSDRHPATQCRMDTYLQGALCYKNFNEDVSQDNASTGTCTRAAGDEIGLRPLCWYKP